MNASASEDGERNEISDCDILCITFAILFLLLQTDEYYNRLDFTEVDSTVGIFSL